MSAISDMFAEGEFTLPVKLTEEEIQERQARYFENLRKINAEDQKLADAKSKHKEQIDPMRKENQKLYAQVEEGVEYKTVHAMEVIDDVKGMVDYVDDAGIVLHSRYMTPSERQQYKIKFGRRMKDTANQF